MGDPFSTDVTGPGAIDRDVDTVAIDFGFAFGERARLIAGYRSNSLDQSGQLQFGAEGGLSSWDIDTDGFELGAEIALGPRTVISAGWSTESRDAEFVQSAGGVPSNDVTTDRDGYFARIQHRIDNGISISASVGQQHRRSVLPGFSERKSALPSVGEIFVREWHCCSGQSSAQRCR